ncbi:unnamed protein product [Trichogramma brassicae]|uniref:RNA helicase n=1 Tax=Trichogramma brassicae TaxID=86971 RepID=A0A6H5I9S3_9HYME|nr:unnamed protein product [Trichogramma brassicae]
MMEFRMKLPAYEKKQDIINLLSSNQVILISGETGCGKTTQVAQFLLDYELECGRGSTTNIICTQPRRISAVSVAERVAAERADRLGNSVGYHIRLERKLARPYGSVTFCTTAMLLQFLQMDPALKNYSHIILDEIHERSTQSDFIITLLKQILPRKKYPQRVLDQLKNPKSEELSIDLVFELVRHICSQKNNPGAILIFLPGVMDITKLHRQMQDSHFFPSSRYDIYPLHSRMPTIDQKRVFQVPRNEVRKIIIATSIAETSITIEDVVYVIDCGRTKLTNFQVKNNLDTLDSEWISEANALQRKGRAGRVKAGICYHLYTKCRAAAFDKYPLPEMLRTRLDEVILQVKILQIGKADRFLASMMDPPEAKAIDLSLKLLRELNALDEKENLTPLGYHLARLPLDPRTGKMIIWAAMFSCIDPVFSIAASLSFKDAFYCPMNKEEEARKKKLELGQNQYSDHIALAEALSTYEELISQHGNGAYSFCRKYFLSWNTLKLLSDMKQQFARYLCEMKFLANSNPKDGSANTNSLNKSLVKAIVCAGLYPNVAIVNCCARENASLPARPRQKQNNCKCSRRKRICYTVRVLSGSGQSRSRRKDSFRNDRHRRATRLFTLFCVIGRNRIMRTFFHEGRKDYECDKCKKKFGQKSDLSKHQRTVHEGRKDYTCDRCERTYKFKSHLLDHQKTVHESRQDFACNYCEKKFTQKTNLLTHLKTVHEGRKDFVCDRCEKKFGLKYQLLRHQKTVHEGSKDYECNNCEKKFGHKPHLLIHQKTVHEGRKDFACDKCEKKFGRKADLFVHQKTIHEGRKDFTCDKCEKKCAHKSSLLYHQKTVHDGRKDFACDKCEKKFGKKSLLLFHQQTVHEGRKDYVCDNCEQKFGLKSNLLKHQKIVHEGHKDFTCDRCEKKFGRKYDLLKHQETVHEGRKDFVCDKCEQKFGRKWILLMHQKTVHEGRKDLACDKCCRDYACDKCEKKFKRKSYLFLHQKIIHEGRKDYACDKCEKKFGQKQHLHIHQKTVHEGRKDYACNKCEKKFTEKNSLFRHIKTIHEGRRDYACDECEKKFGRKYHLLLHQKLVHEVVAITIHVLKKCTRGAEAQSVLSEIHEGRKDYVCNLCEKKFGQKSDLVKHQRIVHEGRKDFACGKCERKFGYKSDLLKHQKIVHEGRRDYPCKNCEKKYGQKIDLFRHQRTVHEGRKDFVCDKCEQKFGRKWILLMHQKTVHEGRKDLACDECEKKWKSCTFGRFPRGSRPGLPRSEHHVTLDVYQVEILYSWTTSSRKSTGFNPFTLVTN